MSWGERGAGPLKIALIGIVLFLVAIYFIFTKALPFTHHYTIKAVVHNSNLLEPGSPVRIGGVTVGQVDSTGRYRKTSLAVVTMQVDDDSQEIHSDATIAIRPRLFLEGNFYVQLAPGTPSAPALADGGTIPVAHTTDPVQLDQVLDAFPQSIRTGLQKTLQGLGEAFDTKPTKAQDAKLSPLVRGLTGGQALNRTFGTSAAALRDSGTVAQALTGASGTALSEAIAGFAKASTGLERANGQLGPLIDDFDRTMQATASQQQALRETVALIGPTARDANTAFTALDKAFPATERFSDEFSQGLTQLPATIEAAYPWLAQAGPLLSKSELGGLLGDLQPATGALAGLTSHELKFLPQINDFDLCMTNVFIPTGDIVVNDGSLSSGLPNYQEFWYAMTGQAGESQGSDGNGSFLRLWASGGPFSVESGQTNYYGEDDTGFGSLAAAPDATRPDYPNKVPPLNRSVPCYKDPIPEVNGPASIGPADGSAPNAPPPPLPDDPTRKSS
jgi:virulence factor Mce-like protein